MKFWKKNEDIDDEELELLDMFEVIQREKEERKALEKKQKEEAAKAEEERKKAEKERIAKEAKVEEEARLSEKEKKTYDGIATNIRERVKKEDICVIEISESNMKDPHLFLGKQEKSFTLGWHIEDEETDVFFYSRDKQIRAVEFLEFLVTEYGKVDGNSTYAQSKMSKLMFKVLGIEADAESVKEFLDKKVDEYFKEYEWLYTKGMIDDKYLKQMSKYKKKSIPWAYVKTTDILPRGEKFRIKMLENESEVELAADNDVYIMIGIKGEIYNIAKSKFLSSYMPTEDPLDINDIMPMYLPTVYACVINKRISLADKAILCYPKEQKLIYAKQLECKTKVFNIYNNDEYFVGKLGDYLVVREDDPEDVYIVQKEIFSESYEKVIDA